jgi:pimeloyl-ACP methyl ester carboxylesterase
VRTAILARAATIGLAVLALAGCGDAHKTTSTSPRPTSPPPPAATIAWTRPDGPVNVQRIVYQTFDRTRVPALFAVPRTTGATRGCLIFEGGLGSTKEQVAPVWPGAARLGLATFSIDFRDHGERAPSPRVLAAALQQPAAIAAVVRGSVLDLERAVAYLDSRPECHHRIAYLGGSFGGIIGSEVAALDPRVAVTVLLSTPPSWNALLRTNNPILPGAARRPARLAAALRVLSPLDPDRYVGRIAPRPVMLVSGTQDPIVPLADARVLEAAARAPKTVITYVGGHDPLIGGAATANERQISAFLVTRLFGGSAPGA